MKENRQRSQSPARRRKGETTTSDPTKDGLRKSEQRSSRKLDLDGTKGPLASYGRNSQSRGRSSVENNMLTLAQEVQPSSKRSSRKSSSRARSRSRSRNPRARGSGSSKPSESNQKSRIQRSNAKEEENIPESPEADPFSSPRTKTPSKRRSQGANLKSPEYKSPSSLPYGIAKASPLRKSLPNLQSPLAKTRSPMANARTARHSRSRSLLAGNPLSNVKAMPMMTARHQRSQLLWEIQSISSNMEQEGESANRPQIPASIRAGPGPTHGRLFANPKDKAQSRRSIGSISPLKKVRPPSTPNLRPSSKRDLVAFPDMKEAAFPTNWGDSDPFGEDAHGPSSPSKTSRNGARQTSRNLF